MRFRWVFYTAMGVFLLVREERRRRVNIGIEIVMVFDNDGDDDN